MARREALPGPELSRRVFLLLRQYWQLANLLRKILRTDVMCQGPPDPSGCSRVARSRRTCGTRQILDRDLAARELSPQIRNLDVHEHPEPECMEEMEDEAILTIEY